LIAMRASVLNTERFADGAVCDGFLFWLKRWSHVCFAAVAHN
jgi:hypothetical protein